MNKAQIKLLLEKGKLWDYILSEELNKKHVGDIRAKEVSLLCAVGRLLKNKKPYSFNCLVLSPSSSGKDHLLASVLKLFRRDEHYETYGRISSKALNYLHSIDEEPNYDYNEKIIYLKEITDEILNNEVMREFTSGEEEISKVAITKQKGGGVVIKEIRGHPSVFATTATTIPTEETKNRFNVIGLDLSKEQIKSTFIHEEEEYSPEIIGFLSNLKSISVRIPKKLMDFIVKNFPHTKQRYKRDFQKLLDFIRAYALFHGRNIASSEDYNRAKDIFMNAYSSPADLPLKDVDERVVKAVETAEHPLSVKEILNEIGGIITIQGLYPHIRHLTLKEILKELMARDSSGNIVARYTLTQEYRDKKPFILPNYED
jgi:hypothetical protein